MLYQEPVRRGSNESASRQVRSASTNRPCAESEAPRKLFAVAWLAEDSKTCRNSFSAARKSRSGVKARKPNAIRTSARLGARLTALSAVRRASPYALAASSVAKLAAYWRQACDSLA